MTPRRALSIYAFFFSAFIVWASLRTALGQDHHGHTGEALASIEVAGALAFAWEKTRTFGLAILLVVFAIASAITLHLGGWPGPFIFYGGSAMLVRYLSGCFRRAERICS